jgi:hypothetical protein
VTFQWYCWLSFLYRYLTLQVKPLGWGLLTNQHYSHGLDYRNQFAACTTPRKEAIKLSDKIRKALQDAGGSKEQHAEAISFLMQFDCVFKELENHVRDGHGSSYREAIVQQLKLIEQPWTRLQELLGKYKNSLGENSSRSRLNMVVKKVKWALKDLNEAVEKVKVEINVSHYIRIPQPSLIMPGRLYDPRIRSARSS